MRARAPIAVAASALLVGSASAAHANIGPWGSPVRLHELARQDRAVNGVVRRSWPRAILVGRRHGNRFIVVGRDADLPAVARVAPRLLVERTNHVWDLEVSLYVVNGATLTVSTPAVRELRLVARGPRYATIVAYDASLRFRGSRSERVWVHSWVPAHHAPDVSLDDGRGSVSVRGPARLDASYAIFSYLGFTYGRASGVAVNGFSPQAKGTGAVDHSRFSHNVFGAYTWEAKNMRWTRDAFTRNIVYGLDPHDASNWFLVDHNFAAWNGRHGIIFSRLCAHNVIRDNVSVRNGWHGIVIDDGRIGRIEPSAENLIYDNVVSGNAKVGVSIDGSNHNVVRNNTIRGGLMGVRVFGIRSGHAVGNTVVGNSISDPRDIGILVEAPATGTRIVGNSLAGGKTGVALRGAHDTLVARSRTESVRRHAVSVVGATGTTIVGNVFSGHGPSVIESVRADRTVERANSVHWRYPPIRRVSRLMSWFVGPGIWGLLFAVVLIGPLLRRAAKRVVRAR